MTINASDRKSISAPFAMLVLLAFTGNASATICGGAPCVDSADIVNSSVIAADLHNNGKAAVKSDAGVNIWAAIPGAAANLRSITATLPGAGRVIVTATGTVTYGHNSGSTGFICLDLSGVSGDTGGCVPMSGSATAVRSFVPNSFPTFTETSMPYTIIETFPVTAGGARTFYLNGYATGLVSSYLFHPTFTVLFVPRALP